MKQKFTGLVLDTETHFKSEHQNLIYDIGWVMGDLRNATAPKIERRFFVKDFLPLSFWKHSYVDKETGNRKFWKIDSRAEKTQRHAFDEPNMVKSWDFIMGVLHADISMVDCVGSYNWAFDSRAIDITNRNLNHSAILPTWDFNEFCLQDMYVRKIVNQTYFKYIDSLDENERDNYLSRAINPCFMGMKSILVSSKIQNPLHIVKWFCGSSHFSRCCFVVSKTHFLSR